MKMSPRKFFLVMVGLVVVLCLLIVGALFTGTKLLNQQGAKLSDLRAENQVIDEQKIALVKAKKDMEKYAELDSIAKAIVPQDKDQARTVREINAIAAESGIQLQAVSFTPSNLGVAAAAPTKPAEGETGDSAAPAPAQPNISQVKPVEGIPGVYALELSISPAGENGIPYHQFLNFLERLENNRRTAHVDNIVITPTDTGGVTFTLKLNVYLKP